MVDDRLLLAAEGGITVDTLQEIEGLLTPSVSNRRPVLWLSGMESLSSGARSMESRLIEGKPARPLLNLPVVRVSATEPPAP